ncbi:MAG: NAD-dependent epimerase/dehydratase family protein [Chitinophagaceae bacterium]|nr:NAD-dependent epimerase/dehydratase family protein [Chitinophagaceae bacterium]
MSKKVLLLGGAGFIGLNIARYLKEQTDYQITIADNFSRGKKDEYLRELLEGQKVSLIEGDFTQPSAYDTLEKDYDQVYMLASVVGVNNTLEIPHEIIRINTALIFNTLEWLKASSVKKVLFTSTSECYAGTIDAFGYKVPTPEEIPLTIQDIGHPRFTYAVTKMLGESGFLNYSRKCGFECTIVRYHNVFGPRMGFKHVIPHLAQRFLAGESPFLVYGHDQTRSFCYITDAVEGTFLAMEAPGSNGEIYHIGTMDEITIEELITEAGRFFGYTGPYENAPTYPGSVQRRCPDISKARKQLGFTPKIRWQEGLKLTLEWYKEFFNSGKESFETSFEKPKVNV